MSDIAAFLKARTGEARKPPQKDFVAAVVHIIYGLGCIVLGVLVMLGIIRHVPFAGVFEWGAILGGAFLIWFGAMAFWWL